MTAPIATPAPGAGAPPRFDPPTPAFAEPPAAGGRFTLAALLLAVLAASTIVNHTAGLALALTGAALMALAATRARSSWAFGCLATAGLLALTPLLRDAQWVVSAALVGGLCLAAIGVSEARTWSQVGVAALRWLIGLVPASMAVWAEARAAGARTRWRAAGPVLRGVLLAAPLVLVFGALFAAADAAFSEFATTVVAFHVDGVDATRRVLLAATVLLLAIALGRLAQSTPKQAPAPIAATTERPLLGRTEWAIALGSLVGLFALFVGLRAGTLFAGHEHVLHATGLTYAQYARQGFGQLTAVAALTLLVLAAVARRGPAGDRLIRALGAALCLLTLVVLASAWQRLSLYEEAFGATRLRFITRTSLVWFAGTFALTLAAGARHRGAALPRLIVGLSAAVLVGLVLSNPDARIATTNVQRAERTGTVDQWNLASLSADAAPALATLPEPVRSCTLPPQREEADPSPWAYNVARHRLDGIARRPGARLTERCYRSTGRVPRP